MAKTFLNNHPSRGLRNNNPGNLVKTKINWAGKLKDSKDTRFEQFETLPYGIRAQMMDIINDISKDKKNTLRKLISEYAPAFENDTNAYINAVAKSVGIGADQQITKITQPLILSLSRAIYKVELGKYHTDITDSDIKQGYALLPKVQAGLTIEKKK